QDTAHATEVKTLAEGKGVPFLVLHHCRKGGAEDPLEEVNGTLGLTGAADGILVLRRERGQCDASLHVTGRDVEEREVALKWDPARALWTILGDADEFRLSKERSDVLAVYRHEGQPLRAADVAELLGKKTKQEKDAVRRLVWKLAER